MRKNAVALAQALADETRWRIANLIADEPLCVCELADILGLPQSTLSSHLKVMRVGGAVTTERSEKWAYYRLSIEVVPILRAMQSVACNDVPSNRLLESDSKKAAARLALRGQSECKGPRRSIPPPRPGTRPLVVAE
jgi:ArsR family transcriptional regulator, arsenate/arsenite/antimonite-responsive transcriptional repressor